MKDFLANRIKNPAGFTLVEVLVSLLIFSVVVVITVGAIFSLVSSGEKSRELNSVMENLNIALETMASTVRFGDSYSAYSEWSDALSTGAQACSSNGSQAQVGHALFLEPPKNNVISNVAGLGVNGIIYGLDNGQIVERLDYGTPGASGQHSDPIPITAGEVHIQNLTFYVYNCAGNSPSHPYVLMALQGYAETRQASRVDFTIQTTMTQR